VLLIRLLVIMSVVSTMMQAPPRVHPSTRLVKMDGPSDRPLNHAVLCGATIASATHDGHFAGDTGSVTGACVTVAVSETGSNFAVTYQVKFARGTIQSLTPVQLFRT
jgi:hypothetical protein